MIQSRSLLLALYSFIPAAVSRSDFLLLGSPLSFDAGVLKFHIFFRPFNDSLHDRRLKPDTSLFLGRERAKCYLRK